MQLPKQMQFDKIKPIAFPSIYKQWILAPMSSNKQWQNNDIVRFLFQNLGDGVFDPIKSHISINVRTNQKSNPVGLLQIDNSAQSFIQQLILYSNNAQIQRVTHYSVLAAYLNDIGLNEFVSQGRQTQGLGYCSFSTPPFSRPQSNNSAMRFNKQSSPIISFSPPTIFPTMSSQFPQTQNCYDATNNQMFNASKIAKGHVSNSNTFIFPGDQAFQSSTTNNAVDRNIQIQGYANNMRSEYVANYENQKFIDSTNSIPNVCLGVSSSVHNNNYPYEYNKNKPYLTQPKNQISTTLYGQNNTDTAKPNIVDFNASTGGFGNLFSPLFSKGTFQPFISSTVPQNQIRNGRFLKTRQPVQYRKFSIPLLSGIMGILAQKKDSIFIPLKAINSILMQLTLDPFAMFTSGYSDYCQNDLNGMNTQQARNYQITRIQYRLQTYHYANQQVNETISFTSTAWSLGNVFQIAGGTTINNNYTIGNTSLFLNQIICLFVPNDYQRYSFCRKHYRISNCVTKFWVRIGPDYWPPQPYKGNGGNPYPSINDYDSDNSVFIENIYWANNYMFDASNPLPRINPFNFAVNQRVYDPTNKNSFYDQAMFGNPNYIFGAASVNADTAMGMSWIHQNRCVGKAAYLIPFSPFTCDDGLLTGINVRNVNNLEAVFEVNSEDVFPRDQSLYIFCRSAIQVQLGDDKITVYGR